MYEESFERDEDDVLFNDDGEVHSLIESESDVLAAVSPANRTLTPARQAVKGARATRQPLPKISTAASARGLENCVGRNKPTGKGSKGSKDNMRGKKGSGRGKGLGVVTMATACTVSAEHEVKFVRSVARRRGFNESCDEYNPCDVYSPSRICAPNKHPFQI